MHEVLVPLYEELQNDALTPPGGDRVIAAFSEAMAVQIVDNKTVHDSLASAVRYKKELGPYTSSHAANMILRLHQMELMEQEGYPEGYMEPEIWHNVIEEEFANPERRQFIEEQMLVWNVQSNVPERYAGPKLVAKTLQGIDNEATISILDVGCSRNLGLAWLDTNPDCSLITVFKPSLEVESLDIASKEAIDFTATKRLYQLLRENLSLKNSYGIDVLSRDDPLLARWQRACSFYPEELMDRRRTASYDKLEQYLGQAANIHFVSENFSTPNLGNIPAVNRSDSLPASYKFDQIIFSTVWYQLTRGQREAMFDNARKRLKENGSIVVQDFCNIEPIEANGNPVDQLTFPEHWRSEPYSYRTLVYQAEQPEAGFQLFARWKNGRCQEIQLAHLALQTASL